MNTIGKNIAYFRKKRGFTQEELAEKMNITPQAISKWENDISYPDLPLTKTLADLLGCTVDELMHGEVNYPVATDASEERIAKRIMTIYVEETDGGNPECKVTLRVPVSIVLNMRENGFLGKIIPKGVTAHFLPMIEMIERGITGELINVESDGDIVRIMVEDYEN